MFRRRAVTILPAIFFFFAIRTQAQDPGAAAAAQAVQQSNQMAAQAAQQANQQMMDAAQQAHQQAMQAQQAAMDSSVLTPPHGRADKPHFYPSSGKFTGATTVTIKDSAPKASIFYTLDGTDPTTSSTLYTGPVLVGSTSQLKAIAKSPVDSPSKVATAKYVIK
jgi:type II secretory pathway pseudopilin PulG